MQSYGTVGLFLVVAILFTATMLGIPFALRLFKFIPHHPNRVKNATFECGVETVGKTWVQFNFRYYYYALLFVALDVIVVFLYPWAVELRQLGAGALTSVLVFLAIIAIGYLYVWKKGVLRWL